MDKQEPHQPDITPPQWANRFLEWYCAPELLDEIQGDLHEAFHRRRKKYSLRKARLLFITEVLLFCKPSSFEKPVFTFKLMNMHGMFGNYLKISWRNTLKNKVFSTINIFGLALGLAACFLILQYVRFELSYDRFHENADQIYRVIMEDSRVHNRFSATNHPATGPALMADFPEVASFARVVHQSIFLRAAALSYTDAEQNVKVFNQDQMYIVDPAFLSIFSFPFVFGDPQNALSDAKSIVISQSVSDKFFGEKNPLGEELILNGQEPFTITGVFEDVPENSHIKFDVLISMEILGEKFGYDRWTWPEYYTYILLSDRADPTVLESKFPGFIEKYLGNHMAEYGYEAGFRLQPITDIHLRSPDAAKEREVHGNEKTVYFLLIIALFILVIAWINYINLSTSKSIERAQEVGLRKVAGASRQQLIIQFLFESALVNFLAIVLSFIIIIVALLYFNQLTGKNISTSIPDLVWVNELWFWLILAGVFVLGSFLAGLYPAFVLSSFRVTTVLKGKFFRSTSGIVLRKALVGSQFVISVALIAGTVMVFRQVSFMRNQDLGYAKDQILVIKSPAIADSTILNRIETYKTELSRNSNINQVTSSSQIPGIRIELLDGVRRINQGKEENIVGYYLAIDPDFLDTYELGLIAGRNFKENENRNSSESDIIPVLGNEKAIEMMGFQNPEAAINQRIYFGPELREIIGVVENHHQRSLRDDYDAILFYYPAWYNSKYFSINLQTQNLSETLSFIEEQYSRIFPDNAFEYFFLDDYFDRQHAADQQFGKVFGLFSSLALVVACLGLFGLSTFMISQRTKEIAVRKVLGATISSMVYLFSKDFVKLIVLANLIALPLVYLAVKNWLNNFAFHTDIGWMMFVIPAILLLIISLATVSFQTIKTGSVNPVNSLRQE